MRMDPYLMQGCRRGQGVSFHDMNLFVLLFRVLGTCEVPSCSACFVFMDRY